MMAMDPYHQTRQNVKRVRKRFFVIGISSVVLIVLIVCLAVGLRKSNSKTSNKGSIRLVQSMCTQTSYPEECVSSVSTTPQGSQANTPKDVATAGIQVAEDQVTKLLDTVKSYVDTEQNVTVRAALVDCVDNLESAIDQLNYTSYSITPKLLTADSNVIDDIITFLSSALTFHSTCIDGFQGINNTVSNKINAQGDYGQKILSNALSLASLFLSKLTSIPLPPVRRLLQAHEDHYDVPDWIPAGHRRLLQSPRSYPSSNLVVAQDGSGNFKRIQDAVDAVPLKSKKLFAIYIKAGVYEENVIVPKQAFNLMIFGDGAEKTVITGSKNVQQAGTTTFNSATLAIGGKGFFLRDVTVRNTAGPENHQAVALRVSADQVVAHRCIFEGFQDTLYAHTLRQFYRDCTILGTVDFVFGNGGVVFQKCNLLARVGLPGQQVTFTAQGRIDKKQNTGLSFINCNVDATPQLRKEMDQHPAYLGRPWKLYSTTVFTTSVISDVIQPRGWLEWNGDFALNTLFYGEYQNTGPGSDTSQRVPWSTVITNQKVANKFTVKSFIKGKSWIPDSVPYDA